MAFPAIGCDVAVLHGLEADKHGNVALNNNLGIDMELVYIARTVIVTVERIVDRVEKSPEKAMLPAPGADYIIHAPRGAWPTSCYPDYPIGGGEILRYIEMCNNGLFEDYLAEISQPCE